MRRRRDACRLLLAAAAIHLLAGGLGAQPAPRPRTGAMSVDALDRLIRAKDPAVVDLARQSGPAIVPRVTPYLSDRDDAVRLLAVKSVAGAGGPQAADLLIRALADPNEQVRDTAVNALHDHLPAGREAALIAAWDANRTRDGYVRQQIPMVLGRLPGPTHVADLRARLPVDPRQEVRDGLIAGLAKLADADARAALGAMLRDARDRRTAELMEFVRYENEPWVIPLLVPVLQRRGIAVRISTHVVDIVRRECDLAVDEVIRISGVQFGFPLDPSGQYRDEQIEEVLRYAQAQPR